jgi:hypothetical protein
MEQSLWKSAGLVAGQQPARPDVSTSSVVMLDSDATEDGEAPDRMPLPDVPQLITVPERSTQLADPLSACSIDLSCEISHASADGFWNIHESHMTSHKLVHPFLSTDFAIHALVVL